MCQVSIIIPAFDEALRIEQTLVGYIEYFESVYQDIEILVITDGCSDETPKIVDRLSKTYQCIKRIHPPHRLGKGGAVVEGIKAAQGEVIGFLDADGSIPPKDAYHLVKSLNGYDGVIASRWIDGSDVMKHEPLSRIIASRCFNMIVRVLFQFPFKDTQCGGKFFKSFSIKDVVPYLTVTGWAFDVDLLYKLNKKEYRIKELPVTWEYKEGSKLDLSRTAIKMLISILSLRFGNSPSPQMTTPKDDIIDSTRT